MTTTREQRSAFRDFIDDQLRRHPVEATIVRRVIRALKADGTPVVSVWDTEERTKASTERAILDLVFNLDVAYLETASGSWVMIVLGNDEDCISDYTLDLEAALTPVISWIEKTYG